MIRSLRGSRDLIAGRSTPVPRVLPQRRSYASVDTARSEAQDETPGEDNKDRPMVAVIGAGFAGCGVGWVLKNRGIPFEIYERNLENSILKTLRQPRIQYDRQDMASFVKYLDATDEEVHALVHPGKNLFVRSITILNLLQNALPVRFGHSLAERPTFKPHAQIKPSIPGEQIIERQRAAFVVGADGTFSTVRWHQEVKQQKFFQYRFPAVVYSCTVMMPYEEWLRDVRPYLNYKEFGSLSKGGAHLHICFVRNFLEKDRHGEPTRRLTHMRLYYSRTASSGGYASFYGHAIHQVKASPARYEHDQTVLKEIHALFGNLGTLDPPFPTILHHAFAGAAVNRKIIVDAVRTARQDLPTHLDAGRGSAPCALVGDAAYSVPAVYDYRSPTQIVNDGVTLGEMIADAWGHPEALRHVPAKYYEKMYPIWRSGEQDWLNLWQKLHNDSALPEPSWFSVTERTNTPDTMGDAMQFVADEDERGDFLKKFRTRQAERQRIDAARTAGLSQRGLFTRVGRKKKEQEGEKGRSKKRSKSQQGFELVFTDFFYGQEALLYDKESRVFKDWLASRESPYVERDLAAVAEKKEQQADTATEGS